MRFAPQLLALVMAVLFAAAPAAAQTLPAAGLPVFRSGTTVVPVATVVRDKRGRVVRGLTAADFQVFDAGRLRDIVGFTRGDDGAVSLALLVDVSGSMRLSDKRASARGVVAQVLAGLRASDEAALFTFDKDVGIEQPFTNDTARILAAFDHVEPFGSTSLYDAIARTATHVGALESKRRAIVVVTDGLDNASTMRPADVSAIASRLDVPVYVLAVVSSLDVPTATTGRVGAGASGQLQDLAWWTGGNAFMVSAPAQMADASREMFAELRHQYVLAIESASETGWRPLAVRTRGRDWVVRARSGYFARTESGSEDRGQHEQ